VTRNRDAEWAEARRLCGLSKEDVRKAKALGMRPRTLIRNRPGPSQRWKAPVRVWVRDLYAERFGRRREERPQPVPPPSRPRRQGPEEDEPWDFESGEAAGVDEEDRNPSAYERECESECPDGYESRDEESDEHESSDDDWVEDLSVDDSPGALERSLAEAAVKRATRLLLRLEELRAAANAVAAAFAGLPAVERVALFGSVARPFEREVRRFAEPRQARMALWHECESVELAAWVGDTGYLKALQGARGRALDFLFGETRFALAHRQVDVSLLERGTGRYLGRLCRFRTCPRGNPECRVPGCGSVPFLQQDGGFALDPLSLDPARSILLFDRASAFGPPSLDRWEDDIPDEDDDIPF
jgi:hypothetical protein